MFCAAVRVYKIIDDEQIEEDASGHTSNCNKETNK